ncbi:vacuolar protein sorting-associated protein 60.1-like [Populus alba x Populus x berolinensis]|nr:vacuolar protein sorting-associated protein 60.1-like [Populus alba x Populus x berolinensis]
MRRVFGAKKDKEPPPSIQDASEKTYNLDQVAFASEGIKDAQQTMSALKSANKELKGMMKTVKIQDIDNLQDEMMDLMDVSNEIQETLGRSYNVPDDIDEEELMGELDALEADMGMETESDGVPSYCNLIRNLTLMQN